jgi:branched-chain amino acid transport system permease protein
MLLQAVASGIALGLLYAGIGAGFSLMQATARLMNLSHGQFVLLGGYVLYVLGQGTGWPWPLALACAAFGGALLAAVLPVLARRLREPETDGLAMTLGLAYILENLLLLGATASYRVIPGGSWLRTVELGPIVLTRAALVAAGSAAVALLGLDVWLRISWTGLGLAAVAQSRAAAASLGVPPRRMERVAFAIAGATAAASGGLVLLTRFLTPEEGPAWTLVGLAVALLAVRPRAGALMAAGIALGVVESVSTVLLGGGWREVVASGTVLLWLLVRGGIPVADA